MNLKAKFNEAYDVFYKEPSAISAQFVKDVHEIINHMQGNCDFLKFSLSGLGGSTTSVLLLCRDADETKDRAIGVSLAVGYDEDGQGIEIDRDHGTIYRPSDAEDINYLAEIIVSKAGREFAEIDMRDANIEAMKFGFGLK